MPNDSAFKKFLRVRGVRIKDLMVLTRLSRATISRHVLAQRVPNFVQRGKYATALGVTRAAIDALFGMEPSGAETIPASKFADTPIEELLALRDEVNAEIRRRSGAGGERRAI